ncbi:HAD family hydrolase [Nonomuraea wenchangensis]|uniref:Hydroxymethylpyrimidine pyrophosphatase n=1 Tax=Nonomuraea wenchangensis TaxID=568860 RepID=A0A1I0KHI7_9ACTN|nr:HAD hydrolase family protein [Nonomuraea wenchangensis]SEU23973.1 hypothetical protein SAMN05421811_10815 [Nonomuraea wenchangensis]
MIRWIVTDLDGTLVGRDLAMVPAGREALLALFAEPPDGAYPVGFCGGEAWAVHDVPELREYARRDGIALRHPGHWTALPSDRITTCMLIGSRPAAPDIPGTVTTRSEATYLEILPAGATKGAALRALAAAEGVPLEEVAAVGDNPNDLDMIAAAGLGVAVGDGHPDVRAAAGTVVRSCADGAVADVVDLAFQANGWATSGR